MHTPDGSNWEIEGRWASSDVIEIHRRIQSERWLDHQNDALSQLTGVYVKTETYDNSESYYVVLKQEGMFLAHASEQLLRENAPLFNSFDREPFIANSISSFLPTKR